MKTMCLRKSASWLSLLACGVATLVVFGAPLVAQTIVTGEIAGKLTDPTGAGIPNIPVSAKSQASGETRTAITNAAGDFQFPLLRPGTYTLSATAPGFQQGQVKATAALGQIVNVDLKLSLQEVTNVVNVTTESPLLQSDNANVATSYSLTQIQNLPTPGNDLMAFANTAPGMVGNTVGAYGGFSSFGLPPTSNLFTLNGNDIMDPYLNMNNSGASNLTLGANEILEAAVVNNGYTGQYGRQAGAQINYVSKSGTNDFHGNALWNWNGAKLNANDFFNNASGTDRPHAVSNQWAWSIGGPIKRNKLFFYVDQEGLRYVLPSGGPIYIPTTDFANTVLSHMQAVNPAEVPFYTKVFNLYAGSSGAGRATPVTQADDPTDLVNHSGLGCGNLTGNLGNYGISIPCARKFQSTVNNLNTEWLLAERVDYNLSDKDRLYFRAWTDRGVQATATDAINPLFSANSNQPQWSTQLGYTRAINARMLNDLTLSGFYFSALFGPPNLAGALALFPTTWAFDDGLFSSMGGGATPNGPTVDGLENFPGGRKVSQWQIVDDFSYTVGRHEIKVGANIKRNDVGDYSYGPGTNGALTFNSMTDFFNGSLDNGSRYAQTFTRIGAEHIGFYGLGFYGQDQWKVGKNFTLTPSLRLDRFGDPTCGRNCFARFPGTFEELSHDANQPYNTAIQLGLNNAYKNVDGLNAQPRIGMAYQATRRTVIRGGVGMFADTPPLVWVSRFFTNAPNVAAFTTTSGLAAPGLPASAATALAASNAAFQKGFNSGGTVAQLLASVPGASIPNFYAVEDTFHNPKYTEWNVEVQQQLEDHVILSVNYVGNKGWDEFNQNAFVNAWSPTGFGGLPKTVPDQRFGEVNELNSAGKSHYNGLTSSLKWRFASVSGQLNYTWAHGFDTCSNNCRLPFDFLTVSSLRQQYNPAGPNLGNSDYDIRHSLTANYLWQVPVHFQNQFLKRALGGWVVAGSFFAHTGFPYSVVNTSLRSTYTRNTSGIGTTTIPADWIGSHAGDCSTPDLSCLTKSQFAKTAQQADFGNLARNQFRGPGFFDTDLTINKNVAATERMKFIVGANFFNVLNHANFDLPVNSLSAGNFGSIISTAAPYSSAYGSFTGSAVSGRVIVINTKIQF